MKKIYLGLAMMLVAVGTLSTHLAWSDTITANTTVETIQLAKVAHHDTHSWSLISAARADASPSPVASLAPPADVQAAVSEGISLYDAIKSGNWSLVAALAIMLLVWGLRSALSLDTKIPTSVLPWISAVFGILTAIGANLAAGEAWLTAIVSGVTIGASASGLWSLLSGALTSSSSSSTPPSS